MISMTGWAHQELTAAGVRYSVEVKSLNNRYLDLFVFLPPSLASREGEIRNSVQSRIQRGRVEVTIRLKDTQEDLVVKVNQKAAAAALESLNLLKKSSGLRGRITMDHLLRVEGLVWTEKSQDTQGLWESVQTTLVQVLDQFQQTRVEEGRKLKSDILAQLQVIQNGRDTVASQAATLESQLRETYRRRLEELEAEADPVRIHSEIALLLVKYSVNEELVRLQAHLDSFKEIIAQGGPMGKKLDFLCQEIGREINTTGSKTSSAQVQHLVVGLKDALENIREQLRNVE